MMWYSWGPGDGYGMAWFGFMHLVWWLALVGGAAMLVRWISRGRGRSLGGEDRAEGILRERFARGEIDRSEYDERLGHLRR